MDLSEFRRRLGAEPASQDAEMRAARRAGPEFEAAAAAADRFEALLREAVDVPVPGGLVDDLAALRAPTARRRWPVALAAGLLLAIGAAGVTWQLRPGWDSVEDYVIAHYRHDGAGLLERRTATEPARAQALLAEFDLAAAPGLAGIIGVIKVCPTPDGRGIQLKELTFKENGQTGTPLRIYSGDTLMDLHHNQALKMTIRTIDNTDTTSRMAG